MSAYFYKYKRLLLTGSLVLAIILIILFLIPQGIELAEGNNIVVVEQGSTYNLKFKYRDIWRRNINISVIDLITNTNGGDLVTLDFESRNRSMWVSGDSGEHSLFLSKNLDFEVTIPHGTFPGLYGFYIIASDKKGNIISNYKVNLDYNKEEAIIDIYMTEVNYVDADLVISLFNDGTRPEEISIDIEVYNQDKVLLIDNSKKFEHINEKTIGNMVFDNLNLEEGKYIVNIKVSVSGEETIASAVLIEV